MSETLSERRPEEPESYIEDKDLASEMAEVGKVWMDKASDVESRQLYPYKGEDGANYRRWAREDMQEVEDEHKDKIAKEAAGEAAYQAEEAMYAELDAQERQDDDDQDEDSLAGDVDKWVHADETRTDEQIAHDDRYRVDPY